MLKTISLPIKLRAYEAWYSLIAFSIAYLNFDFLCLRFHLIECKIANSTINNAEQRECRHIL